MSILKQMIHLIYYQLLQILTLFINLFYILIYIVGLEGIRDFNFF